MTTNQRRPGDTTATILVAGLRATLREAGVNPTQPRASERGALTGLGEKERLAETVLQDHGPALLLQVGETICRMRSDPIVGALLSSQRPMEALSRWTRLQRYLHLKHPARITEQSEQHAVFVHRDAGSGPPNAAANIVLAGVIAALIRHTGAAQLNAKLGADPSAIVFVRDGKAQPIGHVPPQCDTGLWRYNWRISEGTAPSTHQSSDDLDGVAGRINRIIRADLMRAWTLTSLASELGLSSRSMQRRLRERGATLTQVTQDARIERAVSLLADARHSLSAIGYACGFSDHAHFVRSFKHATGMPPGAYREMMKS